MVSIVSDECNQSSIVFSYVVIKSLYLRCRQVFFLPLFLIHIACQRRLWDVMPCVWSFVFLFFGPFQKGSWITNEGYSPIIIIIIIIILLRVFFFSSVSWWLISGVWVAASPIKSSYVTGIILSVSVVWMALVGSHISESSGLLTKFLGIVQKLVSHHLHVPQLSLFSEKVLVLSFRFLWFFLYGSPGGQSPQFRSFSYYLLKTISRCIDLARVKWSVCISKSQWTDSGLCI